MYLTIRETAKRLSVCTKTIERKIKSGEIPAIRLGEKAIRIDEDALKVVLANSAVKAKEA